jgi:hypothetical protein
VSLGLGPTAVAAVSDGLRGYADPLGPALSIVTVIAAMVAATSFWLVRRPFALRR